MSTYQHFAQFYDRLTANISYKKRAEYFDTLISRFGGKKGILLDLGCGTGSLSEEMAKLGYDVIGVDTSAEMLNIALDKKYESGLPIQYLQQDMTKLDMFGTIDVTLCALDSLNHLSDFSAVEKTFARVSLFSEPDGLFIFDVNTPYKHRNILGDNTFVYDLDDIYCVWQNRLDEKQDKVFINLDFFERQGEVYSRWEESFCERAYSVEALDKALKNVGFEVLAHFDYDTLEESRDNSEKIVFAARKVR